MSCTSDLDVWPLMIVLCLLSPDVGFLMFDVWCLMSENRWCILPSTLMFDVWWLMFVFWNWSDTWCLMSDVWCRMLYDGGQRSWLRWRARRRGHGVETPSPSDLRHNTASPAPCHDDVFYLLMLLWHHIKHIDIQMHANDAIVMMVIMVIMVRLQVPSYSRRGST